MGFTWGLVFQRESEAGGQVPPPQPQAWLTGAGPTPSFRYKGTEWQGSPAGRKMGGVGGIERG